MEDAQIVFNKMSSHDAVSWNAIIGRYAIHGPGMEALKHFEQMCEEGVQPNDITFVCLLLACSCAGLVDEGLCYCVSMSTVYMISANLKHYTCMVDLLGHAGHLQEAENMIKASPVNQMWLCGWLCSVLAEFMVMWTWENALLNKFLKWSVNCAGFLLLSNT
jgi:pentatricopeptide repeat protein